jgi:glutathione S-transferase
MFFEQYDLEPAIAVARFWVAYSGRPEEFEEQLPEKLKAGRRVLATLDQHLQGRSYVVGDSFSLADIALYGYTHVAPEGGFELESYPAVRAWLRRVASEPGHVPIDA